MKQAEREEDEADQREQAPHERSRYVLDEAEESGGDGDMMMMMMRTVFRRFN